VGIWQYLGAIYRAELVSFEIAAPVEIAVERLARVTSPSALLTMFQEALVGRVTASSVVLRYHRPWFSSTFAPVFIGTFTGGRNRTSLEGRFTLPWFAKAILTVWLAIMCLALVINVVSFPNMQGALLQRLATLFMPLLMLVLGVFAANIGWWIGRRDVEYISRRVREALNSGGTEPPNEPDGRRSAVGIG
jgi:hypothetical protein